MGAIIGKENLASIQSVTDNIPGLTTYQCAILGLDTAGKTTVLYRLKFDQYVNAAPTIGFNCEKVRLRNFLTKLKMKMRYLLRIFDCLAHPNLSATFATDQK